MGSAEACNRSSNRPRHRPIMYDRRHLACPRISRLQPRAPCRVHDLPYATAGGSRAAALRLRLLAAEGRHEARGRQGRQGRCRRLRTPQGAPAACAKGPPCWCHRPVALAVLWPPGSGWRYTHSLVEHLSSAQNLVVAVRVIAELAPHSTRPRLSTAQAPAADRSP